jgi:hypothetical protein
MLSVEGDGPQRGGESRDLAAGLSASSRLQSAATAAVLGQLDAGPIFVDRNPGSVPSAVVAPQADRLVDVPLA